MPDSAAGPGAAALERLDALVEVWTLARAEARPGPYGGARATTHGVRSRENFEALLSVKEAPLALALFGAYAAHVGIPADSLGWQLSCLPSWVRDGNIRAGTLNVGRDEVFAVWLDRATGEFRSWLVVLAGAGTQPVDLPFDEADAELRCFRSDSGRTYVEGFDPYALPLLLADPDAGAQIAATLQSLLARTRSNDQTWNNDHLVSFLGWRPHPNADAVLEASQVGALARAYAKVSARRRLHQQAFRDLLFSHTTPVACAVCGLTQREVLDAAHLTPDAEGGLPTLENGAILCASHHRAFDAGMLAFINGRFLWVDGAEPFHDPRGVAG